MTPASDTTNRPDRRDVDPKRSLQAATQMTIFCIEELIFFNILRDFKNAIGRQSRPNHGRIKWDW